MANNINLLEWALGTDNKPTTAANRAAAFEDNGSGVMYQLSKSVWGAAGVFNLTSVASPMPVSPIFNGAAWSYGNRPAFDQYFGGSIISLTNGLAIQPATGSVFNIFSSRNGVQTAQTGNKTLPAATLTTASVALCNAATGEIASRRIVNNSARDIWVDPKGGANSGRGVGVLVYAKGGFFSWGNGEKVPVTAMTMAPDVAGTDDLNVYFEEIQ